MITVTRLNGKEMIVNALLIETIESTPDTMITLTTGKKVTVLEGLEEVIRRTILYLQTIGANRASVMSMESEEL
ncbi:MAG: flagellar FlbD family protein [Gorillibacterium sp.]|nr:flagellar FlbD family protein [Gorillibacterium sp.]